MPLSLLCSLLVLLALALDGVASEPTEINEGIPTQVMGGGDIKTLRFRLRDKLEQVTVYVTASTGYPIVKACPDKVENCDESVSSGKVQLLELNKKNVIESMIELTFPGDLFFTVQAQNDVEVKLLVYNSKQTLEGWKYSYTRDDGYDYAANENYRYFHTFVCPSKNRSLKFKGEGGKIFGVERGLATEDKESVCEQGNEENVCIVSEPASKNMYGFSILVNETASEYSVMSQTLEPELITLDTLLTSEVSPYEMCVSASKIDLTNDTREDSLVMAVLSMDTSNVESIYMTIYDSYYDLNLADLGSGINVIEFNNKDELPSQFYIEFRSSYQYYIFEDLAKGSFNFKYIVSHDLVSTQNNNPVLVSKDSIDNNIKNSFFVYPVFYPKACNYEEFGQYDIIYSVEIVDSSRSPITASLNVCLNFENFDKSGSTCENSATEIKSYGGIDDINHEGNYISQGIFKMEDFPYDNPVPIMTISKKEGELLDSNMIFATIAPISKINHDEEYFITVKKGADTFFSFPYVSDTQSLEIGVDTPNISYDSSIITISCSQKIYTHNNPYLSHISVQLKQRKTLYNLNQFEEELNSGEDLYCSIYYKDTSSSSESSISLKITSHTTLNYVGLYEGSPLRDTITVVADEEGNVIGKNYKLIGDSLINENGEIDQNAENYNLLFAKIELISFGEEQVDGSLPTNIDEEDNLIVCLSTEPKGTCFDSETGELMETSMVVNFWGVINLSEVDVNFSDPESLNYFHPDSTYIIVEPYGSKASHVASYILTVGYGISSPAEDIYKSNFNKSIEVFYNNNNKDTVDNHIQFVRFSISGKTLLQTRFDLHSSDPSITEPLDYTNVIGILCPTYPETDMFFDSDIHMCHYGILGISNSFSEVTLYSSSTTGNLNNVWYLSLIPFEMDKKYKGASEVVIQLEYIIGLNETKNMVFTNTKEAFYPMAFSLAGGVHVGNALLSFTMNTKGIDEVNICVSSTTPQATTSCIISEKVEGEGLQMIDIPMSEELIGTPYPDDPYGTSYVYLTVTGPEDYSSMSSISFLVFTFSLKTSAGVNGLSMKTVEITTEDINTAPSTTPLIIYFLPYRNEMANNVDKLLFVLEPPKVSTGSNDIPDFYTNSRMKFELFPNTHNIEIQEPSVKIEQTEQGYIVYPLGRELIKRSITDISEGIALRLTPIYDSFRMQTTGTDYYAIKLGLFYEDGTGMEVFSVNQLTPLFSHFYKTDATTDFDLEDGLLTNYFRITPDGESASKLIDLDGLLLFPCKGMPTIYYANSSKSQTIFPSSENNDLAVHLSGEDDYLSNKPYVVKSDEFLNQYININFSKDDLSQSSYDYSYAVVANDKSICIPEKDKSDTIDYINSFVIDGHPFITIGYNPGKIPSECGSNIGVDVALEYTMYYYTISSKESITAVEDIPVYEIQPSTCGMQEYGKPAILDDEGNVQWSEASDDTAAILRSNQSFDIQPEDEDTIYVFNILGRIMNGNMSKYIMISYSGLVVPLNKFQLIEDGRKYKEYTHVVAQCTTSLSPSVIPLADKTRFFFYAEKFYFHVEVSDIVGIDQTDILFCINEGDERCAAGSVSSNLSKTFNTSETTQSGILFNLKENSESSGIDSITHYSAMFGPVNQLSGDEYVNIKVFGTSLHELFVNSYFSDIGSEYRPTRYFVKVMDDTTSGQLSMEYGYIDLREDVDSDNVNSMPNIELDIVFDADYLDNNNRIYGNASFGADLFVCSEYPLTDPELLNGVESGKINDNCVLVTTILLNKISNRAVNTRVGIPFGYNKATKTNSIYVNGEEFNYDNIGSSFNVSSDNIYFIGFVTRNIEPGFEWNVTTRAAFPIDISTTLVEHRTPTTISTPNIFVGKDLFVTIYNEDSKIISDTDKCGLYVYPRSGEIFNYNLFVCASSTTEFPSPSKDQCDIFKDTFNDPRKYIPFTCKNAAQEDGKTYFNIQFVEIEYNEAQFIVEVIRSKGLDILSSSETVNFSDLINIKQEGDKYYCGGNPLVEIDTSITNQLLPKECFTPYAFNQDISELHSDSLVGVSLSLIPSSDCDLCYENHTISFDGGKDTSVSIMTSIAKAGESVLSMVYYPTDATVNKDVGSQLITLTNVKDDNGDLVKYVGFSVRLNEFRVNDIVSFSDEIGASTISVTISGIKNDELEKAVIPLSYESRVETTMVYDSPILEKDTPSYVSMYMSTVSGDQSVITVSPCIGKPTVYGSPFELHPTSETAKYTRVSETAHEFDISVTSGQAGLDLEDVTWYFNIMSTTDDQLQYELYPNNNYLRPSSYSNQIKIVKPSSNERDDENAKFAIEFNAFGIPKEVIDADKDIEIRYKLYGFTNDPNDGTPMTACAAKSVGKSIYIDLSTGNDYLSYNNTNNVGTLKIFGNRKGVDFNELKYVVVVGEYTLPNGTLLQSSTSYTNVVVYESFPWWGILIIVLLVLVLIGGIVGAVIALKRYKKKQGDYLLEAQDVNDPEDEEYVANFETMN